MIMPSSAAAAAAEDVAFLESLGTSSSSSAILSTNDASAVSTAAMTELHKSGILRIQTDQLLEESVLHLTLPERMDDHHHQQQQQHHQVSAVKWAHTAHEYMNSVADILRNVDLAKVNFPSSHNITSASTTSVGTRTNKVVIPPQTHLTVHTAGTTASTATTSSSSGSRGELQALGRTTKAGNAHVLPTLTMRALIPTRAIYQGKDYQKHGYFEKRNAIVQHMAQHLASSEYTSRVGHVYWRHRHADAKTPVLLLVPPPTVSTQEASSDKRAKKKTKQQQMAKKNKTSKPVTPRFRVLIEFGMDDLAWIPPMRLLPNRNNVGTTMTEPDDDNVMSLAQWSDLGQAQLYNQALLEDASHIFEHATLDAASTDIDFHHWNAVTVLAKIWALQRGLLGRHDGLTTSMIAVQLFYLFQTQRHLASPRLGSLPVLAAWLKFLAETNWLGSNEKGKDAPYKSADTAINGDLIRKAPSEAYVDIRQAHVSSNRAVLVMPSSSTAMDGDKDDESSSTTSYTHSVNMAQLYARQTKESPLSPHDPPTLIQLYQQQYALGPILLDSTMTYNFLGRISPACMRLIQSCARQSLTNLHGPSSASLFASQQQRQQERDDDNEQQQAAAAQQAFSRRNPLRHLFLTEARFWTRHDAVMHIPLAAIQWNGGSPLWSRRRRGGRRRQEKEEDYETIARAILQVLRLALGDRVHDLQLLSTGNGLVGSKKNIVVANKSEMSLDDTVCDAEEIPTYPVRTPKMGKKSKSFKQTEYIPTLHGPVSPTGRDDLVLGIVLNPDTCWRVVDRGPPADDIEATRAFVDLWGKEKAELRRFKDGAIVHAVVWETTPLKESGDGAEPLYVEFQNAHKVQGGIVERIIRHLLQLHFLNNENMSSKTAVPSPQFSLRSLVSCVDALPVATRKKDAVTTFDPLAGHRMAMKAFETLSDFLRTQSIPTIPIEGSTKRKSRLGIPLAIDAVEPLAPALRFAELFPPFPHPFLGCKSAPSDFRKISGAVQSEPILMQIRFGASSKWPTDLRAIGAAKTAMLIQLVNAIESLSETVNDDNDVVKRFDGPMVVTPSYADVGFMGFVFRIMVRADPELKLLRRLTKPSDEAAALLRTLTKKHVVAATYHSMVHAVYASHPSSSFVTRLARRWVASHLLSGLIPFEAIELIVVHVYTDKSSPMDPPGTVVAGFMRFLHLMGHFKWQREPLIVDPQGHFEEDDYGAIAADFDKMRGPSASSSTPQGPPMYIISPCDRMDSAVDDDDEDEDNGAVPRRNEANKRGGINSRVSWKPLFTLQNPEWVVLGRVCALAQRSFSFLQQRLTNGNANSNNNGPSWAPAFQETASSFRAYSALLRVDAAFVVDQWSSSSSSSSNASDHALVRHNSSSGGSETWQTVYTESMHQRYRGPKDLQRKVGYRNLLDAPSSTDAGQNVLHEWRPVDAMVQHLRSRFDSCALFFYNDLTPEVVCILWRPHIVSGATATHPFSVLTSSRVRPVTQGGWQNDTLVQFHTADLLREAKAYTADIICNVKVLDAGAVVLPGPPPPPQHTPRAQSSSKHVNKTSSSSKTKKRKQEEDSSSSDEDSD